MLRQRELLRRESRLWDENNRDPSFLIQGKRLEAMLNASTLPHFEMSQLESIFLSACNALSAPDQRIGINMLMTRDALEIRPAPPDHGDWTFDPEPLQQLRDDPAAYSQYLNDQMQGNSSLLDSDDLRLDIDPSLQYIHWEALSWLPKNVTRWHRKDVPIRSNQNMHALIVTIGEANTEVAQKSLAALPAEIVPMDKFEADQGASRNADIVYILGNASMQALRPMFAQLSGPPRLFVLDGPDSEVALGLMELGVAGVLSLTGLYPATATAAVIAFFEEVQNTHGLALPSLAFARKKIEHKPDRYLLSLHLAQKDGELWYQPGPLQNLRPFTVKSKGPLGGVRNLTLVCGPAILQPLFGVHLEKRLMLKGGRHSGWTTTNQTLNLREAIQLAYRFEDGRAYACKELLEDFRIALLLNRYGEDSPLSLSELVRSEIQKLLAVPDSGYNLLVKVRPSLYVDTNPIPIVYSILKAAGRDPQLFIPEWRHASRTGVPKTLDLNRDLVLQLYGCVGLSDQEVLTQDDHMWHLTALATNSILPPSILATYATTPKLYLGFSFRDPGFRFLHPLFSSSMDRNDYSKIFQTPWFSSDDSEMKDLAFNAGIEFYRNEWEDTLNAVRHLPAQELSDYEWD